MRRLPLARWRFQQVPERSPAFCIVNPVAVLLQTYPPTQRWV
jgi:hypothetical protein